MNEHYYPSDNTSSAIRNENSNRGFHNARRKLTKRMMKPVEWNDMKFESLSALGRYLGYDGAANLGARIRDKKLIKGHLGEYVSL